jgi:hypothetical protein
MNGGITSMSSTSTFTLTEDHSILVKVEKGHPTQEMPCKFAVTEAMVVHEYKACDQDQKSEIDLYRCSRLIPPMLLKPNKPFTRMQAPA